MESFPKIKDSSGRIMRKLRISLLDACNYRCFYCMPEEVKFMPKKAWLTKNEIVYMTKALSEIGMSQVRLTGGEPFLRTDCIEIIRGLSELNLERIGVTTNGFFLEDNLNALKGSMCKNINISLDSLNTEKFNRIAKKDAFSRVVKAILSAKNMGFNVKINTVLMRGINFDEIEDFVEFSAINGIEIRFLEMMKIGQANTLFEKHFTTAAEAIKKIRQKFDIKMKAMDFDSTSFNYEVSNGANIGFIASESKPFCNSCSRLRLSASGFLRSCLMVNAGANLRGLSASEIQESLLKTIEFKPKARVDKIEQNMYQIGG